MATDIMDAYRRRICEIGWSEVACRAGLNRATLYRCFNKETHLPTFSTLERVGKVIGLRITAVST